MISFEEADQLVSYSSRYAHMQDVSSLMAQIAEQLNEDPVSWSLVELLHDLDYDETKNDKRLHGLKSAKMLEGKLTEECLDAIKRHDHCTGLMPESGLDYCLILCDSISLVLEASKQRTSIGYDDFTLSLNEVSVEKPWLRALIFENPLVDKVDLKILLESK